MVEKFCNDWIVCQIGAREHYAITRALIHSNQEVLLYTDYWAIPKLFLPLPSNLRQRYHQKISSNKVVSWNSCFIVQEMLNRVLKKDNWESIVTRNKWFSQKVVYDLQKRLKRSSGTPIVFAYSYAAKEILTVAKAFGCPTILGQIDPGPVEMRLVEQLHNDAGIDFFEQPGEEYWTSWREECELADRVVVNSRWSLSALEQEGVNPEKMVVVPLAYEHSQKQTGAVPERNAVTSESPLRALFLGQVNLRKGILELAQAIELMEGTPVEWTIVGGGDAWLIDKLKKLSQTVVVGQVSRHEAAEYYRSADVFILPTHSDGYAITQLEAASFGLPVIASRFCGEFVRDGENGLVLKGVTAEEIQHVVNRLIVEPGLLASLRSNMTDHNLYTIQNLSKNLLKIQESLLC